jgi:hypothetical protein
MRLIWVGVPDAVLNPKKKIFEAVQPELKTNGDLVATYKGCPFTVKVLFLFIGCVLTVLGQRSL